MKTFQKGRPGHTAERAGDWSVVAHDSLHWVPFEKLGCPSRETAVDPELEDKDWAVLAARNLALVWFDRTSFSASNTADEARVEGSPMVPPFCSGV